MNPYQELNKLKLPQTCIGIIFSYYRPHHPMSQYIKKEFYNCEACNIPLTTKYFNYEVSIYLIQHHCNYWFLQSDRYGICSNAHYYVCNSIECQNKVWRRCKCHSTIADSDSDSWWSSDMF